jgi:hypothetical protein
VKLSQAVLFQPLRNEAVLLDLNSDQYIGLDLVATRIWQLLAENGDTEYVVRMMLQEYDVDEARFRRDLAAYLEKLMTLGLIQAE